MVEKKVITANDLGPGDGGKGGVIQKICAVMRPHTLLKVGGAQGCHGTCTARGEKFNFSQFGCGTFEGIPTHITRQFVAEPYRLLKEAEELRYEWGITNIFSMVTMEEDVLLATPFHMIASRLRELARKDKPKGTIGIGIGEAKLDSERFPDLAIYARDLGRPYLRDRLHAARVQKIEDLSDTLLSPDSFWPQDRERAKDEIELLYDDTFVDRIVTVFNKMGSLVRTVGREYLAEEILSQDGVVVVESSHGILTDKYYGFHPNISRLRTVPQKTTFDMLKECGYDGEVVPLAVFRAYAIRHGAGPMVTEDPTMNETLLPGSNKAENRWQGKVRVGPLDLVSLRYSIDVCGGPQVFKGLAVTWFDQVAKNGRWDICDSYTDADNPEFFTPCGRIKVSHGEGKAQLARQGRLTEALYQCKPVITSHAASPDPDNLIEMCTGMLEEQLGIPVKMISLGPTENDKYCL